MIDLFWFFDVIVCEMMLFVVFGLLIGGIDDILIDVVFVVWIVWCGWVL